MGTTAIPPLPTQKETTVNTRIINETQTNDDIDLTGKWERLSVEVSVAQRNGENDKAGDALEEMLELQRQEEGEYADSVSFVRREIPVGLLGV